MVNMERDQILEAVDSIHVELHLVAMVATLRTEVARVGTIIVAEADGTMIIAKVKDLMMNIMDMEIAVKMIDSNMTLRIVETHHIRKMFLCHEVNHHVVDVGEGELHLFSGTNFNSFIVFILIYLGFILNRRAGPVVKRIDNYGPPNAKSPFSQGDDKGDSKLETTIDETIIKKNESQSADENVQHAESLGKIILRFP